MNLSILICLVTIAVAYGATGIQYGAVRRLLTNPEETVGKDTTVGRNRTPGSAPQQRQEEPAKDVAAVETKPDGQKEKKQRRKDKKANEKKPNKANKREKNGTVAEPKKRKAALLKDLSVPCVGWRKECTGKIESAKGTDEFKTINSKCVENKKQCTKSVVSCIKESRKSKEDDKTKVAQDCIDKIEKAAVRK